MRHVDECYKETEEFPISERFGLSSQIRRSAVSIPSNIAEGCGRDSPKEFARFLRIAYGSGCELETQLLSAGRLGYGCTSAVVEIASEVDQVRRMIYALLQQVATET
jgi:four helix bundle protein